jgi:hypothetical protein
VTINRENVFTHSYLSFVNSYMSFLNLQEQHSLLDYLKCDPCLPEELVDILSKLEESIAKLTDTVCVLLFLSFLG